MLENYEHQVEPFAHQLKYLEEHCYDTEWGLLWEAGTAKTKPIIDNTAILYKEGKINGLIVVAPPGVERNWKSDELPVHMPPDVALDMVVYLWETKRKSTKGHKQQFNALCAWDGLAVMLISYNAFMTKEGKNDVWKFLKKRRCMYVLDESHNIKTPKAKRTRSVTASGRYGSYRRILTGTPMAIGPFDLYSQVRFLDENFWKRKGINTAAEFRQMFGVWITRAEWQEMHHYDPGYDKFIEYKNLHILKDWLEEISDRLLLDDVLDLPPGLYSKRYFEMSREQTKIYNELRDEMMYEFDDGQIIEADLAIVRLLRLQQVLCNYLPTGEDEPVRMLTDKNPRLNAMEQIRDETYHPALIWARFIHDVDQIVDLLGDDAVRYDGTVDDDTAERNKLAFQRGDKQYFVGTAAKGGPGLTLHMAKTVVYYSNTFRYIDRAQSEARARRAGMDNDPVNYIDIMCQGTVDDRFITNLRAKRDVYSPVLGDTWKEWL